MSFLLASLLFSLLHFIIPLHLHPKPTLLLQSPPPLSRSHTPYPVDWSGLFLATLDSTLPLRYLERASLDTLTPLLFCSGLFSLYYQPTTLSSVVFVIAHLVCSLLVFLLRIRIAAFVCFSAPSAFFHLPWSGSLCVRRSRSNPSFLASRLSSSPHSPPHQNRLLPLLLLLRPPPFRPPKRPRRFITSISPFFPFLSSRSLLRAALTPWKHRLRVPAQMLPRLDSFS